MLSIKSDRGGDGRTVVSSQHPVTDDPPRPWYVLALLLPSMIAAILLGVLAYQNAWWLWPAVVALGVPPLIIVWPKPSEGNGAAWHLRQFQRPR